MTPWLQWGLCIGLQVPNVLFVQSPYWSHTASGYQGQYAPLDNQNEIVIGYARQYKEGEALVRGAYERSDRKWRYNLAMGFSNPEGSTSLCFSPPECIGFPM